MMRTISFEQVRLDAAASRPKAQTACGEVFSSLFEKAYEQAGRSERLGERQVATAADRRQGSGERTGSAAGSQTDPTPEEMIDNESWLDDVDATESQAVADQEPETIEQPDSAESVDSDEPQNAGADPGTTDSAAQPEASNPQNGQTQSGPAAGPAGEAIRLAANVQAVADPAGANQTAGKAAGQAVGQAAGPDDSGRPAGQVQVKPVAAKSSSTADAAGPTDTTGQPAKVKTSDPTLARPAETSVPARPTTDGGHDRPAASAMAKEGSVHPSAASESSPAAEPVDRPDTARIASSVVETTEKIPTPAVSEPQAQAPPAVEAQPIADEASKRQDRTLGAAEKNGAAAKPPAAAEAAAIRPAAETHGAPVPSEQRSRSEIPWAVQSARSPEAAKTLGLKTPGENPLPKSASPDAARMQENVDHIVRTARAGVRQGSSRMQIRLEPPELGSLRIEIKQNADGLTMQLQVSNAKAQQLLQQNAHELRAALDAQGLQPRQIDIQLRMDLQEDSSHPRSSQEDAGLFSRDDSRGQPQTGGRDPSDANSFESFRPAESDAAEADGPNPPPGQWQALEFNAVDLVA
ncbi:MAG: flagellar hook-length control protein FliK [Sedimentisphaerales bacterium]|nr:flagellar hook-length control protein FliK [Sedimentisphaerales bacterium]